ncbi:Apoptosis-associated speck-like protein containing a CARD [Platysternon megacephalum]|uniref:Apoptosis-associated speck-like protein containing a CARD n=1 Tax=Platysternon megacephalum TaxID=55544 RepID=A0A4D9DLS2_9SAUR|nr:Apoptosis-associated speck-like protein containing a CARD [Platysternon megacephalum]
MAQNNGVQDFDVHVRRRECGVITGAIQTWLVTGNCSQHSEVFTLRAHEGTMDVHCDTVTGAATQAGLGAAAFISYSTLDSIINATLLSEGNLPAGGKLQKSHLNSRVVSGAIGDGRPIHLSRPAHFTLRHRQVSEGRASHFPPYLGLQRGI